MTRTVAAFFAGVAALVLLALGTVTPAAADNELATSQPTFYVLAPGGDTAAVAPIVTAVTKRLQALFDAAGKPGDVWVIPRTTWGPDDLYNQCVNDPTKTATGSQNVIGGIILDGTNAFIGNTNSYIVWARNWSKLSTNAQLVSCAPVGFKKPTITWVSPDVNGYGSRNGFPVELAAVAGLYFASSNNSNAKAVALGASLSAFESTTTIPPVDTTDATRDAAHRVANDLIEKLTASCKNPLPRIAPICGKLGLAPPVVLPPSTPEPSPSPSPGS